MLKSNLKKKTVIKAVESENIDDSLSSYNIEIKGEE